VKFALNWRTWQTRGKEQVSSQRERALRRALKCLQFQSLLFDTSFKSKRSSIYIASPFVLPEVVFITYHPNPQLITHLVIPDPVARRETISWIRAEFERNKHITDLVRAYSSNQSTLFHSPSSLLRTSWRTSCGLAVGNSDFYSLIIIFVHNPIFSHDILLHTILLCCANRSTLTMTTGRDCESPRRRPAHVARRLGPSNCGCAVISLVIEAIQL